MLVDLVQVTTRDDIRLDGAYIGPSSESARALNIDGLVLVHGTGGNFYSSTMFDAIAERLAALGCAVLRANTRGHDGISTAVSSRGARRLGAAYEVVADCRHDLAAWVDWLKQRAGPKVGLIGHSLGAVKCIYTLAQPSHPEVACVIAISPPRLSYSWFCSSASSEEFLQTHTTAEQLVAAGRPDAILEMKVPLPLGITAAGFLEKYGPAECYNFLNFLPAVRCPTLVTLGDVEVATNMAFQGLPDAVAQTRRRNPQVEIATIANADHFYTGVRPELIRAIEGWLRRLLISGSADRQ